MAGRRVENDEWELHKDEIHRLFITEGCRIAEVVDLMTQGYGFTRTRAQYQTALKRWDFNKNITKED
ncbi:Clr5 domain-containing protein [Phaeosphaeriaceae sp. PMI808]|nr:Clr5 domain-containing protein [Phaeosphaeriaceae sp. PMI808]